MLLPGKAFTKKGRWRMNKLLACLGKAVQGVLTGFDRIVFKGTILPLAHEGGAMSFLRWRGVLNRDYKKWMLAQTDALVTSVELITGNATRVLRCFAVSGITNAALRKKLCKTSWGAGRTDRQLSARVSRHLRLLRDHGLIRKLPNRHRYHLTNNGRQLTTALHAMLSASTEQLLKMAA